MGARHFHLSLDLGWLIERGGASEVACGLVLPGSKLPATEVELLAHAVILRARGFECMPTCAGHNRSGRCMGHVEEVAASR